MAEALEKKVVRPSRRREMAQTAVKQRSISIIRCDNGPEYISGRLTARAEQHNIQIIYTQPGNPQQNAYIERYNRTVRYDWLAQYLFDSIKAVQDFGTQWLWHYNHERPNMALGGITPKMKSAVAM